MMKNLTARTVTIHQGVKIATMSATNIVPHMLAPEEVKEKSPSENLENDITIPMKSVSVEKDGRCSSIKGDTQGSNVESPCRQSTVENEKPELDRTPLKGVQLEKLYELTKLAERTAGWTEEQQQMSKKCNQEILVPICDGNS